MIISINGEERYFNDTHIRWTKKWYPRIKIWLLVYAILCSLALHLYSRGIAINDFIFLYLPFIHWALLSLFILVPEAIHGKYHFDYIEKYYPEISKKIWVMGRGNGIRRKMGYDDFYPDNPDVIIEEIVTEGKKKIPLLILPFIIGMLNMIDFEFIK